MPASMTAMVLDAPGHALRRATLPVPQPGPGEVLIRVTACAVCRTDLHIVDGDLAPHLMPLVPGHEIVGRIAAAGRGARSFRSNQRVGVPWLGGTCGTYPYCVHGDENLCDRPVFTGYDRHGGFADYPLADERICFVLPDAYDDVHAAPLLCAGLIGYRAYAMVVDAWRLGLHGEVAASATTYPLQAANEALRDLRAGHIDGAAVLVPPADR
jgi:propanol-preferring alcohol dehydrogenase